MALAYAGNMPIPVSDHRGGFCENLSGISGEPTARGPAHLEEVEGLVGEGFGVALTSGRPSRGHAGFAVGRTIWWDAVAGWRTGIPDRERAAANMAAEFMHFTEIYEPAAS